MTDWELERIRMKKYMEMLRKMENKGKGEERGVRKLVKVEVNDGNFEEEVIERSKDIPVVVDFWAEWCMPCLALAPVLEKLAKEYNGRFVLAKLNVDRNPQTASRYGIMSIPTVIMFKNGKPVDSFVGVMPEPMIREWLDRNL
ncbi:MAG TPA: thioredoxin [Euryarchaeota archaeon]|nr:MAG: thioredoxin [Thermococci archaeon]RLF97187.1 MAG: thioredoxin [Thermococci archaeon]HDI10484.1 thioredoxin [Euryarchaeota archaeon]